MRTTLRIDKQSAGPSAHGLDRLKLLRYCLARLRAWRSEYELYSLKRLANEIEAEAKTPTTPTEELAVIEPESPAAPTRKDAEMYVRESRWMSSTAGLARLAPDSATFYGSSIDTESVQVDSPGVYQPAVSSAETKKSSPPKPEADSYSMANPLGGERPESASPPDIRSPRRAFEPLPGLSGTKLTPTAPAAAKLRVPKIVSQILGDAPDHWKGLAEAIGARVKEAGLKSLMVGSALRGEGCTTVATALAMAVAQHGGLKVVLVDGNFSHPGLATMLKLPARVGMEHHLRDNVALSDTIVSFEKSNLSVLPTLEAIDLPSIVLGVEKVGEVIERLCSTFDLVIVDQGALFAGRKPTSLPASVDAALLVRDPSKCSPELLDQLDTYVARHHVSSLGVIENGVDEE
jgi:Mrp family chromosome partitioning ATPase